MVENNPVNAGDFNAAGNGISYQQLAGEVYANLPVAVYTCNHPGYITSYNKAAADLWGRQPEVLQDQWCGSWKAYDLRGQLISPENSIVAQAIKNGVVSTPEEIIIEHTDGSKVRIKPHPVLTFNSTGVITGAIITLLNISEITNSDEKQAMLAAIVNTSDDTILSKTLGGVITSWNKAAENMFGYTQHEAIGKHISLLIPPSRIQEEEYIIGQIAQGNPVEHFETVRLTKAGKEIAISLSVSPVKDGSGKIVGASKIARDISGQKEAEKTSKRYTERLEMINHIIKLVSEELDLNKILQKVADATTQLTGAHVGAFFYNKVNISGESVMISVLSGTQYGDSGSVKIPQETVSLNQIFQGLEVVRINNLNADPRHVPGFPTFSANGSHLPMVSYLAVPVVSRSGEIMGGLFFGHPEPGMFTQEHEELVVPIAAQAATGLDNAQLYEEVKALNEKKNEFIGLASHELKTPLTSITGYLQILERMKSDDSSGKFVTKTIQQVKKLTALVSDLLDVSKIEAGKLQLLQEKFSIKATLEDAIELIQHSHNTHQITFHSDIEALELYGDAHRIEQVIINLLTNAIKYSYLANRVEVYLTQTNSEVKVGVKDYGIGIAPAKRDKVFSRFYRVEELNPHISGLGIGLYISHEIITRHNGKLWVESELEKGSIFWFTLPL